MYDYSDTVIVQSFSIGINVFHNVKKNVAILGHIFMFGRGI